MTVVTVTSGNATHMSFIHWVYHNSNSH